MSMMAGRVGCKSIAVALAGLGLWLAGGTAAWAVNRIWVDTTPAGDTWHDNANWDTVQPTAVDMAIVTNGYKAVVTSDVTITNLQVRKGSTLRLESGTLRITEEAANTILIGDSGNSTGTVEQVGGTLEMTAGQAVYLGHDPTATFIGRFSGGSLICTNSVGLNRWLGIGRSDGKFDIEVSGSAIWNVYKLHIGYTGTTTNGPLSFRQKDSSIVTGNTMVVGFGWGATYYMDGGINSHASLSIEGKTNSPAAMIVTGGVVRVTGGAGTQTHIGGGVALSGAQGLLSVQGGSVTLVQPILGRYAGCSGAMTISGGGVLLDGIGQEMAVGYNGSGTLNLSGGGLIVTNGALTVGRGGGAQPGYGSMTVSGGDCTNYVALNVGIASSGGIAGPATGLVQQTGGTWIQRANTTISGKTAEFTLLGGTFVQSNSTLIVGNNSSGSIYTGLVAVGGGTLDCNALIVGYGLGDGTLIMTNGVLLLRSSAEVGRGGGNNAGRGTLMFSGGAITNTGTLNLGYTSGSTGIVVQSGGTWVQTGATTIGYGTNTVGSITVTGGVFQATNTVTLGVVSGGNTGSGSLTVGGMGRVFVTNATGTALLDIKVGEFKLTGGTATVNRVVNSSTSALTLNGGRLKVLGSLTNNAAGPWVIGNGTQVAVLELATASTVTNRAVGGVTLTNNAFLATSGVLGTNVTVVGTGGLEWTAVADTNASPGLALTGSGALLAFDAGAAPVLRLNNPQELVSSAVIGKTYTLMTWTGADPLTQPAWTIDYGDSRLLGGAVQYDLVNNKLLLTGFTSGAGTVMGIW